VREIVEKYSGNSNIFVLVLDFETLDCEEAVATDFSGSGCRIQSTSQSEVNKVIGLRLSGIDKMIKGRIREVRPDEILVAFEFQDDATQEKRKEKRRPVAISAMVSAAHGQPRISCQIVDASLSGCRLHSPKVGKLPDTIFLHIPGIDLPVRGCIVWRSGAYAGVRMMWQFSGKSDYMAAKPINPPPLAGRSGAGRGESGDTTFGRNKRR